MVSELHPASDRGHARHGWLDTWHSFSFAGYFNPIRNNFGVLRVLNDDVIQGGTGFAEHPHNNMEIITIPLSGQLEHRDSMGNSGVISPGEVQVMSAGTGILHSEYNYSASEPCNFLQLWIFPRKKGLEPAYHQMAFDPSQWVNRFQLLVTPDTRPVAGSLTIGQDAWISISRLSKGKSLDYSLFNAENYIYAFIIEGTARIEEQEGSARDAVAIKGASEIRVTALSDCEILLIEIPEK